MNMLSDKDRKPDEPEFDARKYPMVVINLAGMITTFVSDPNVVQEMYTGHGSKILDKFDILEKAFGPLMSDTFGFMPGNELWKARRKTVGHMFFK